MDRSRRLLEFLDDVDRLADGVFADTQGLVDHRVRHPWLRGCLGDPFSPIWFVAENPSLRQVERAIGSSPDLQWSVSAGDKLFRKMLVKHGFKTGGDLEPGGWRCYITDVVKSADGVNEWKQLSWRDRCRVAEAWAPVLRYELERGSPELIVILGGDTKRFLDHLRSRNGTRTLIPKLPPTKKIHHYSYIMQRAQGKLGPGHPLRIDAWDHEFAAIAATLSG
jgi:hypothetical protein